MISNPDLIFYACVAKGSTILVEYCSSKEPGIEEIAKRCIEKTPNHHLIFSHTVRQKTYTFLIRDPLAYFIIHDENLVKSESVWFLDRLKLAFDEFMASKSIVDFEDLTYLSCQSNFYPILREILAVDADLVNSFIGAPKEMRNSSMDSSTRTGTVARPLLAKPPKMTMKKKKRTFGCGGGGGSDGGENGDHHRHNIKDLIGSIVDNKVNHVGDNGIMNREFSVSMHKNGGGFYYGEGRHKAKQIWRKHVWVVLILDLVICAVLFGIWLWVCRGFKCIDG